LTNRAVRTISASAILAAGLVVSSGFAGAVPPPLFGNIDPALASSPPAAVAVVAQGAPVGSDVAVLVHNGTSRPVRDVRLEATATHAPGAAPSRAKTAVVVPSVIGPGALGLARVSFGKVPLAPGDDIKVTVKSSRSGGPATTPLTIVDAALSRPLPGPVAQQVAVTLANDSTRAARARGSLGIMCFGEARNPVLMVTARVPNARVAAGGTTTTTVDLPVLCPAYLVGFSDES
jgi:hypothetical protein